MQGFQRRCLCVCRGEAYRQSRTLKIRRWNGVKVPPTLFKVECARHRLRIGIIEVQVWDAEDIFDSPYHAYRVVTRGVNKALFDIRTNHECDTAVSINMIGAV